MLLERHYDEALAQASYLIGCERAREAIVIDPNRDIDRLTRAAAAHGMRITHVTETHIHADYLSGSRELARATGAALLLSGHSAGEWRYGFADEAARLLHDGDVVTLGSVRLQTLHTPGHTPEHLCFLVTDAATGDRPMGIVSGDFLFVGDVGRPDLLERAAQAHGTMESAARQLHASLQRLSTLPDYLQVWPGHGAGSACGKSLGSVPQSTLGYERLYNPALLRHEEDDFVRWVLADQPEPPNYFAVMKRLNRDGPPPRPTHSLRELDLGAIEAALGDHWVVDLRGSADFAEGHLPGTINIPMSNSLATYAGTALTYDRPIALIARTADQAHAARRHLALIGLDDVSGYATAELQRQAIQAGHTLATTRRIEPRVAASEIEQGTRVIDVRGRSEWNEGHLAKATHIYLGHLAHQAAALDPAKALVIHCQGATRSSIAASLLKARGFTDVSYLAGGIDAWKKAGLPVVREEP